MTDLVLQLLLIMELVFTPLDNFFAIIFCWSPSTLRTFTASMLTLTLGAILSLSGNKSHLVLKYLIYFFFLLYSIYQIGLIHNINEVSVLDFTAIAFSIIAPICMIIVGKKVASTKIKGYKIFNYYTLWLIYFLICLLWAIFYPEVPIGRALMLLFVGLYIIFSLLTVWIFSKIYGGI